MQCTRRANRGQWRPGPQMPSMQYSSPAALPCLQVAPLLPQVFRQLGAERLQHNHAQLLSSCVVVSTSSSSQAAGVACTSARAGSCLAQGDDAMCDKHCRPAWAYVGPPAPAPPHPAAALSRPPAPPVGDRTGGLIRLGRCDASVGADDHGMPKPPMAARNSLDRSKPPSACHQLSDPGCNCTAAVYAETAAGFKGENNPKPSCPHLQLGDQRPQCPSCCVTLQTAAFS